MGRKPWLDRKNEQTGEVIVEPQISKGRNKTKFRVNPPRTGNTVSIVQLVQFILEDRI